MLERLAKAAVLSCLVILSASAAPPSGDSGLLFYVSGDKGLTADIARGDPAPNFADHVRVLPGGAHGAYIEAANDQVLSWNAASNIYAQRGTLAFLWRARTPLGRTEFPIFRVGYADHTSWDMTWLRIDWNGHGLDAFVTDANLARVRVSARLDTVPAPDRWIAIAFTWDETQGIRLYVDGKPVASKDQPAVLDAGLDQFGPHSRVISPHQVQSAYSYLRGGDIDEIRIYDHALTGQSIAALAAGAEPTADAAPVRDLRAASWRAEWAHRYGFDGPAPILLAAPATRIRKVEFTDAWDLKERMSLASDGIAETTWPGVYNRSRLPGRHDYFELPDWNVYVEGGKAITFDLPNEPWNHLEFQGAAYGTLTWLGPKGETTRIADRTAGDERSTYDFVPLVGGKLRFENVVQETPIQELQAYDIASGAEPRGVPTLSYTIHADADPAFYPSGDDIRAFIDGRFPADERATDVALPDGAPSTPRPAPATGLPIVHILVPADFRRARPGGPVGHFSYGWENLDAGLDGIALDIPPLQSGGPLNIQVKDPLWPARNLIDVTVAVPPGAARTVFLDSRDRLLPGGVSLYLSIAGADPAFDSRALDGMHVRLIFKPRAAALAEHVADRLAQARDNLAYLVEEHDNARRLARFERLDRELTDLLRADPTNVHGREMWAELNPEQGWPSFDQPKPPAGVPLWAFRQVEDLKLVRRYIDWWIDKRQVPYGDFGGGISDDDDLTQQWPPLALLGVEPDKIARSLNALADAANNNGMITGGLGTIRTDQLHSYEEGINAESEAMYLSWGDPKTVERLMATARAVKDKLVETNAAGHAHIVSSYFSATDIDREGEWGWSKPYSYLILHPAVLLARFNGNPAAKAMVLALADGYLAHGKQQSDGSWTFPQDINATNDADRGTLSANSNGLVGVMQLLWQAYEWTGNAKYLRPLTPIFAKGDHDAIRRINASVLDVLGKRDSWGKDILAAVRENDDLAGETRDFSSARDDGPASVDFQRFVAWQMTNDPHFLEDLYGDEMRTDSQRMWMVTDAHWWSDRVELFSDLLQRSRLGGMALRRNQYVPGNLVGWDFAAPASGEDVAILIRDATPTRFSVVAYNLSAKAVAARMTGWTLAPGTWRLTGAGAPRDVPLETARSVSLSFPPRKLVSYTLERVLEAAPPSSRPDLGIGRDDIRTTVNGLDVTVHSLGSVSAPAGELQAVDAKGLVLAHVPIPPLAAPLDLLPKTVTLHLSKTARLIAAVRVALPVDEITTLNNEVRLGVAR